MDYCFRIAKTGSRTLISILASIGKHLGFQVQVPAFQHETLYDDRNGVRKEIYEIISGHENNIVRSRHYSFINFKEYGLEWYPDWFSIVRDPVERVIQTCMSSLQINKCQLHLHSICKFHEILFFHFSLFHCFIIFGLLIFMRS